MDKPWSHIEGFLAEPQPTILHTVMSAYNRPECVLVEVGSWTGRSSIAIASAVPQATLYCVDPWREAWVQNQWRANTSGYANIREIQGYSPYCVGEWSHSVSAVFLDASHSNPNDWTNCMYWLPRIQQGGVFMGHDYSTEFPDVVANVNRIAARLRQPPQLWPGTSLWCFSL